MIQPQNMPDTVEEFMKLLQLAPDTQFTLRQNDPGMSSHGLLSEAQVGRFLPPSRRQYTGPGYGTIGEVVYLF